MAGPWEDYGGNSGPWADYARQPAPAAPRPNMLSDLAQSGVKGVLEGTAGLADAVTAPMMGPVANFLQSAAMVADTMRGHPSAAMPAPMAAVSGAVPRIDPYTPKTKPGEYARSLGQMLPNAIAPASLTARVASVVIPGVTAQAAADGAKLLGLGPKAQLAARVTGGAAGLAAPFAFDAVTGAAGKVGGGVNDAVAGVRNTLSPPDPERLLTPQDTANAAQQLRQILSAQGADEGALASDAFGGKPVTTAEAIGRPGVQTLGALARRAGSTGDALEGQLTARASEAPSRITADFAQLAGIHPQDAGGDMEAMVERGRAAAKPLFDAALSDQTPVWNADLAQLATRPVIQQAIDRAATSMLNAGKDPTAMGFKLDPDTGWTMADGQIGEHGGVVYPEGADAMEQQPTAATWDLVRKNVNSQIERHPFTGKVLSETMSKGNKAVAQFPNVDINTASRDLTQALAGDPAHGDPGAITGYRAALDTSGDYLRAQNAFDRGQSSFLNSNISAKQFSEVYNGLDEPSQRAFKAGVAAKLEEQLQKGRLRPNQFAAPAMRGKLATILGPEGADTFLGKAAIEARMAATGSRMVPGTGSPTMEFANAALEQDAGTNPISLLLRALKNPHSTAVDMIAQGRTLGTTPQVRNELGRLLMQPPQATLTDLNSVAPPPTPNRPQPRMLGLMGLTQPR